MNFSINELLFKVLLSLLEPTSWHFTVLAVLAQSVVNRSLSLAIVKFE